MDFLPWSNEYSVEVAQIDAQHKHLVGLINGLHEVMKRGGKPEEVHALLEDLLSYTGYHFTTEERLMAAANYAGLAAHHEKHQAMTREVKRLAAEAEKGGATFAMTLMTFLKNWLTKHIDGTDKQYIPAMKQARIA